MSSEAESGRFVVYGAIASILIGGILAAVPVFLSYQTRGLLIGESASTKMIESIFLIAT